MLEHVFINAGYLLMLAALLARDILWLRALLMCAQTCLATFAYISGHPVMVFWNLLFVGLNAIQVALLLHERRPIHLEPEMEAIYNQIFHVMKRREFLYFWEMGELRTAMKRNVIKEGEAQRDLILILDGQLIVRKGDRALARLNRGSFAAEMSFLTGEAASADVYAEDLVYYVAWPQEKLRSLQQLNPHILMLLQNILGRDLTHKLKAATILAAAR